VTFPETISSAQAESKPAAGERWFVSINFFGCIILQRFGIISGTSEFFLCYLIFFASGLWALYHGYARIRLNILQSFCVVSIAFLSSVIVAALEPNASIEMSPISVFGALLFNLIFVLGPRRPLPAEAVYGPFVFYVRLCAAIAIAQYLLQFIGIRLFSIGDMLPFLRPVLLETHYNADAVLHWGSNISRATGLFLLEPSILSQLIAVGTLIDVSVRKQIKYVPLYAVAYLLTYSGTGLLCLVITLAITPIFAPRESKYVLIAVLAGIPLVIGLFSFFPSELNELLQRSGEFDSHQSSGYQRYVAQAQAWSFFSDGWRSLIGSGPGAYERFPGHVPGSGSAAIKVFAEYGLVGLLTFSFFIVFSVWNRQYALISLMMLVVYQFGGGNLLQPPILILMEMLCVWTGAPAHRSHQKALHAQQNFV
jgi:hypothetical protein